ncbi:hypothetical protein D3OALGA1CA_1962 [Olavius algarvensis associated proteobacterium Delta 3]|nr:hypothetical protein D3OALGA1CA_1962 [Olavius algarvensis associated proteobacterium Delta 3]CAB5118904.1 hypothetical protein D3OALGB2SA_2855 [Olavius algarvensis associated proteobacterium Delta 3]
MEIVVKLYGDLKRYAPGDRPHFALRLETGSTLENIFRILAIPEGHHTALINGRRSSPDATVANGDTLVIMPLISGG